MLNVLERAKLVLEAEDPLRVQVAERLQRDARVTLAVQRFVDDAHPAGTEPAEDLESGRAAEVDLDSVQGRTPP